MLTGIVPNILIESLQQRLEFIRTADANKRERDLARRQFLVVKINEMSCTVSAENCVHFKDIEFYG